MLASVVFMFLGGWNVFSKNNRKNLKYTWGDGHGYGTHYIPLEENDQVKFYRHIGKLSCTVSTTFYKIRAFGHFEQ